MAKPFNIPIETKKAVLEFYSICNPDFDQSLCEYMKQHNLMHLIGKRGKKATKGEVALRKQVEHYQKKLKDAKYLRSELASNGFDATPTSSASSKPLQSNYNVYTKDTVTAVIDATVSPTPDE